MITLLLGVLAPSDVWRYVVNLSATPGTRSTPVDRIPIHSAPEVSAYNALLLMTLLLTVPGISWILAYTIAAEIGDIGRFESPKKLCG